MKVLFVVNENPDSGIRVYADTIMKELNKINGIKVVMDEKLDDRYDLIHVHSCRPENLGRLKLHQPYTPIVASTHMTSGELQGLVPDMALSMLDFAFSTFYLSCEKVFVTAPHIMRELEKNPLLKKKLVSLPYPLDKNRFPKINSKDIEKFKKKHSFRKKKTILCVASIQYRKGIFDFVEAAEKLPQYDFVWIGKVPNLPYLKNKDEIEELMKKNKPSNLKFISPQYGKDLACAYSACDLFWLPSFSETFGLVIIEAASFARPVLIRNIPVKELFEGFVQTYSSSPEEKVVEILEDKSLLEELSKKAISTANKFEIKDHIKKLVGVYKEVTKK